MVRYLIGALPDHTKLLLSADKLSWLADTIEAARLLAPAMVVIEDVDLIAAHRDGPWQQTPAALDRLLNETVAQVSRRIGKVSPAFIKELARRAAQVMMERAGERLEDADFDRAFADMSGAGSKMNASLCLKSRSLAFPNASGDL